MVVMSGPHIRPDETYYVGHGLLFPLTHLRRAGTAAPKSKSDREPEGIDDFMTLKQACLSEYQKAQGAFKDSMIH